MPKLLVVDGSPMMHRIMELTFAPEGIQVVAAADGDQAIALLPIARPDIVIADHAVSGRSGYDVSAFIKGHPDLSDVPVLLLASPFEPLDRARAEACGVAGEIAKPFEPAQLIARVRALLAPKPLVAPVHHSEGTMAGELEPPPASTERVPALKLVEPQAPPSRGALDDYFDRLDAALERLDEQIGRADDDQAGEDDPAIPTIDKLLADDRPAPRGGVLIDHPLRGAYAATEPASPMPASDDSRAATPRESAAAEQQPSPQASMESLTHDPADADRGAAASTDVQSTDAEQPRGRDLSSLVEALEALRRRGPAALPPLAALGAMDAPLMRSQTPFEVTDDMIDEVTRRVVERLAPGAIDRIVTDVVTQVAEKLLREEIARLK